ncbi:MAG: diacylglycerol kinase family protein [bacterium]|nr:diacylglycerol kinase family protein [bacterium]
MRKHTISFGHAIEGIVWAFKTQPNFKIHSILSVISLLLAGILKISSAEFLVIVLLITVGFTVEAINTAIEEAADLIETKWSQDIKHVKDVAAGAMLLFALGAGLIACIIFIPKLFNLFGI